MRDIYAKEYTELRNAPHFIFNGQHTRDFNVTNVQIDSGLAKDTFLADRNLTIERTRYNDKSYLLGYTEEPLKFKVRLLFDEHKFNYTNIAQLRRWLHTETFKEFRFDNEEESALNIIVYAMVSGTSDLTHNVIDDGYLDIEFTTNSSRRYSEVMEDNYDFSKSGVETILQNMKRRFGAISNLEQKLMKKLKQYIAKDNYAGIEEVFSDANGDKLPDGWKLITGSKDNITIDEQGKMSLSNVKLRKNLRLNNNHTYFLKADGENGKINVSNQSYDIDTMGQISFDYHKNLLGNKGQFIYDTNSDGVGDGWTKVAPNPNLIKSTISKTSYFLPNNVGLGTSTIEGEWTKITPESTKTVSVFSNITVLSDLIAGEKYTFSFTVKVPAGVEFTYYIGSSDFAAKTIPRQTTEKVHYIQMPFTKRAMNQYPVILLGTQIAGLPMYVKDVKIEAGDKATYTGNFAIEKPTEKQYIGMFGRMQTQATLLSGLKYILIGDALSRKYDITINGTNYKSEKNSFISIPFISNGESKIILAAYDELSLTYKNLRLYRLTDEEYNHITSQLSNNPNITIETDYSADTVYNTVTNTGEKFSLTGRDIYKVIKKDYYGTPPVSVSTQRYLVNNGESVTASIYYKHEGTNVAPLDVRFSWYNYAETKIEATTTNSTLEKDFIRMSITYHNYSGVTKELTPLFYPNSTTGNITYFTSPQIEYNGTVTDYKLPFSTYMNESFAYFGETPYFELDFTNETGYVKFLDMYEVSDIQLNRLENGEPFNLVIGFDYDEYIKVMNDLEDRITDQQRSLIEYMESMMDYSEYGFGEAYDKILILSEKLSALYASIQAKNDMRVFQFSDVQPRIKALEEIKAEYDVVLHDLANKLQENYEILNKSGVGTDVVNIYNFGDKAVSPVFEFTSTDGSDIIIINRDTQQETRITDNQAGEVITMIGATEQIETSRNAPYYKYDHHDDVFIKLKRGENKLEFIGNYTLKITYQFILL